MKHGAAAGAMMVLSVACALPLRTLAQMPPPPFSGRPGPVPVDPANRQAFEAQQEAFRAYERCVAEHRKDVDLHNASRQIVEFRNNRATLERALQADSKARERVPGGVDEALARTFGHYKALGGPAASAAEVTELPTPCPAPRFEPARREPAAGSAAIISRRELIPRPGMLSPLQAPSEPPRTFTPAASPPLRRALEQSWLAHVMAVRSGTEAGLEKTMSTYYYAATRNRLARGGPMTAERIALYGRIFPDLNPTRFVTLIENGPTAALVHARDSAQADSSGKQRVEYFFFRFADEGHGWKVDGFAIINAPKYQADGSPAPFRLPTNPSPDYRIDGRIRRAPALLQGAGRE